MTIKFSSIFIKYIISYFINLSSLLYIMSYLQC